MSPEQKRLERLRKLEKVRAMARHAAAIEAAQAEASLRKLNALSERTRDMAGSYRDSAGPQDGAALAGKLHFVAGLHGIAQKTASDALAAGRLADQRQTQLANAERRRAAIADRIAVQERVIARAAQRDALGGKRAIGTPLE